MKRIATLAFAALAAAGSATSALGFDLGSRWSVTEVSGSGQRWHGTWTRIGPNTFRAHWRERHSGQTVSDTIRVVGWSGSRITLHRVGLNGHYHGRISPDGSFVSGGASWYGRGDHWSASVH